MRTVRKMSRFPVFGLLIATSIVGSTALGQQESASPASSTAQTTAPAPAQIESRPTQDQDQDQDQVPATARKKTQESSAALPSETTAQRQHQPAKMQKPKPAKGALLSNGHHAASNQAVTPQETPKKVVVRQGGAEEPTAQIVTGMTPEEADRQRRDAESLLSTTDEKLKEISPRPLDSQEQETVSQIHNYMDGSRLALKQGDVSRAHTLALKAGLLANDLASH